MLTQKIFGWMHKVALFAIVFASLAPSISHALASQSNARSFLQEVCSASGQKLYIQVQVVTTKGKQLQAGLDLKPEQQPITFSHHMEHCPFCHAGMMDVVLASHNPAFELYLAEQQSLQRFDYQSPVVLVYIQTAHLTRAPPLLIA
jgi:hypothetical protein